MKKYGLHILIILLIVLQIISLTKIVKLENDLNNIGNYLSTKIDNVTSKVNVLPEKIEDINQQ